MSAPPPDPTPIVSPRVYALILTSPRLARQLLPEGFICSPYQVLDYDITLVLEDTRGSEAVYRRRQRIQFQQDGVAAILDHFWGDGVTTAGYATTAGRIADTFKDGNRHHLVIGLKRPMRRGEILEFTVERRTLGAFTQVEEWSETAIDHPIARLSQVVRFPKARPCQTAQLEYPGGESPLHGLETREGTTEIGLRIPKPRTDTPYLIRWTW